MSLSQFLGFSETGLVIAAYVPQIYHVIKEHCSVGISLSAYSIWFLASVLFLIHAAMIKDLVFIITQVANRLAISIIVVCTRKYEKHMCRTHLGAYFKESMRD